MQHIGSTRFLPRNQRQSATVTDRVRERKGERDRETNDAARQATARDHFDCRHTDRAREVKVLFILSLFLSLSL